MPGCGRGSRPGSGVPDGRHRGRWARIWPYLALFVLAVGLRVFAPGPIDVTIDEPNWLIRSRQFAHAVVHLDPSGATAWGAPDGTDRPTMPGVTTMWAGSAGRLATRVGAAVGLNEPLPADPTASAALLRWSRSAVAVGVGAGLVVLAAVTTRLLGRRVGLLAGFLGAVEPWFVGHGFVLHTDALVATWGVASLVGLLAALRAPPSAGQSSSPDLALLVVSGVAGAVALLTKLNAVALVLPGAAVIIGWDWFTRMRVTPAGTRRAVTRSSLAAAACWGAVVGAVSALAWPALWAAPVDSVRHLWMSLFPTGGSRPVFFAGSLRDRPGVWFYPVALVFRMSSWLLIATAATVGLGLWRLVARFTGRAATAARLPALPWVLAAAMVPYGVAIARYDRHYDRYAMPFVVMATVLAAGGLVGMAGLIGRRFNGGVTGRRVIRAGGVAVMVGLVGYVASLAPYAISYVDPLLGGQRAAEGVILLGWGEGRSALGERIAEIEAGRCDQVGVWDNDVAPLQVPCGRLVPITELEPGDYLFWNVKDTQRGLDPAMLGRLERVDAVDIGGVDHAVLYRLTVPASVS